MCLLPPNAKTLLPGTACWPDRGRIQPEGTLEPVRHETPSKQPVECLRSNFSSLLGNICLTLWLGKGMGGREGQGPSDQRKWSSPGGSCYRDIDGEPVGTWNEERGDGGEKPFSIPP